MFLPPTGRRAVALCAEFRSLSKKSITLRLLFGLPIVVYPLPCSSMRRAIYPGSFDPVTNGHLDIIARGCKLFDEIIIAILVNPDKKPLFSIEERRAMLHDVLLPLRHDSCNLIVEDCQGLLVHDAVQRGADAIVRGIRA